MPASPSPASTYLLRVRLEQISPAIWRDLLLPGDTTLDKLHAVIQAAFPWTDSHLHQFEVNEQIISDPSYELEYADADERTVSLAQVAPRVGNQFAYEYDLGDGWRHEIHVKEILPLGAHARILNARCVGGSRACPPDDCGGARGYGELLLALALPNHARHDELSGWLTSYRKEIAIHDARFKGPFDPEAFDLDAANKAVGKSMRRGRT